MPPGERERGRGRMNAPHILNTSAFSQPKFHLLPTGIFIFLFQLVVVVYVVVVAWLASSSFRSAAASAAASGGKGLSRYLVSSHSSTFRYFCVKTWFASFAQGSLADGVVGAHRRRRRRGRTTASGRRKRPDKKICSGRGRLRSCCPGGPHCQQQQQPQQQQGGNKGPAESAADR